MRQLKFRAWDNEKKKWIYPYPEAFWIIGETTVFDMLKQYSIKDYNNIEIVQFTGLLDKNDVEIYEDDIIRTNKVNVQSGNDYNPYLRQVRFDKDNGCFRFYLLSGEKQTAGQTFCKNNLSKNWEIIGNNRQNKELLNE